MPPTPPPPPPSRELIPLKIFGDMLAVIEVMASMVEATRTMVSMTMAINMVKATMIKVSPQRNG